MDVLCTKWTISYKLGDLLRVVVSNNKQYIKNTEKNVGTKRVNTPKVAENRRLDGNQVMIYLMATFSSCRTFLNLTKILKQGNGKLSPEVLNCHWLTGFITMFGSFS